MERLERQQHLSEGDGAEGEEKTSGDGGGGPLLGTVDEEDAKAISRAQDKVCSCLVMAVYIRLCEFICCR